MFVARTIFDPRGRRIENLALVGGGHRAVERQHATPRRVPSTGSAPHISTSLEISSHPVRNTNTRAATVVLRRGRGDDASDDVANERNVHFILERAVGGPRAERSDRSGRATTTPRVRARPRCDPRRARNRRRRRRRRRRSRAVARRGGGGNPNPRRRGSRGPPSRRLPRFEDIFQKHFAHGCVNPGMCASGAPPKYPAKSSASSVADTSTILRSGRRGRRSRSTTRRKLVHPPLVNLVHEDVAHARQRAAPPRVDEATPRWCRTRVSSRTNVSPRVESDTPPIDPTPAASARDARRDGDGGDATRLRAHHRRHGRVARRELGLEHELRQPRRLAASGLAAHHDHPRPRDRVQYRVPTSARGEFGTTERRRRRVGGIETSAFRGGGARVLVGIATERRVRGVAAEVALRFARASVSFASATASSSSGRVVCASAARTASPRRRRRRGVRAPPGAARRGRVGSWGGGARSRRGRCWCPCRIA